MFRIPVTRLMLVLPLFLAHAGHAVEPTPSGVESHPATSPDRDATLQLQVFLDRQGFPPGKIDGKSGDFLAKALGRYQQAHGLPATGVPGAVLPPEASLPPVVSYVVTARDRTFVGPCPSAVEDQAALKSLPYASMEEFLSERFHCAPALLHTLNPGWSGDDLTVGTVILVPNVEPFQMEALPRPGAWPGHPEFRHRTVEVHRAERMLDVREGAALIASFPVTPGGDPDSGGVATPPGTWHITAIAVAPTFRWDKSVLERGVRSDTFFMLPPGPNNPVGVLWCALNRRGIGIHGTDHPMTIGRAVSHGCIRMANWDVVRFAGLITPGVAVTIE